MGTDRVGRIALLWAGDREARQTATARNNRLARVFEALAALGVQAEPAVYSDEFLDEVRDQLVEMNGVLVWVNPVTEGRDRANLDSMLREVAAHGVWVSAHPDVILKMGTKEVLYRTRNLGWGTDCRLYSTVHELQNELPQRLASGQTRVLKQHRGNGGDGVWKITLLHEAQQPASVARSRVPAAETIVEIQHALRGSVPERVRLGDFIARCEPYFGSGRCMIDQAFQERLADGMIRCYMVHGEVVGFGQQLIKALLPPPPEGIDSPAALPGPRLMHDAWAPPFQVLRSKLELEWIPQMQALLDIPTPRLPAIWDADFLYGPKTESGADTYVLCEINVSSVFPFPDQAITKLAKAARAAMLAAKEELG